MKRLVGESLLPRLELDISNNNISGAVEVHRRLDGCNRRVVDELEPSE